MIVDYEWEVRTMAVKGRSGNMYPDAVRGKTGSELIRMQYSQNEIEDILGGLRGDDRKRRPRYGDSIERSANLGYGPIRELKDPERHGSTVKIPKTFEMKRYHPLLRRVLRSVAKIALWLIVAYAAISIYNGVMDTSARGTINDYSVALWGHEALDDQGVIINTWSYIINPAHNVAEVSRSMDVRTADAYFEAFGSRMTKEVREKMDSVMSNAITESTKSYRSVPSASPSSGRASIPDATQTYRSGPSVSPSSERSGVNVLFNIEDPKIVSVDVGALWTDVTLRFKVTSHPGLDSHRDASGKIHIPIYIEYQKDNGSIEISQTYGVDVLGDGVYEEKIPCIDVKLSESDVVSATFGPVPAFGDYYVRVQF